ncbi:MAG: hypothetical protein VCA55_11395 [Verrucomicrobiales bacterium]
MRCGLLQLAFFLVITVITPLLLRLEKGYNYNYPKYVHGLVDDLRSENPQILLIGNSMLYSRIDIDELERLSGKRVGFLAKGGSASACWYLYLKNIVAPSGVQPEQVIIFFRDRVYLLPVLGRRKPAEPCQSFLFFLRSFAGVFLPAR